MAEITDPDILKEFETPAVTPGAITDPEVLKLFDQPDDTHKAEKPFTSLQAEAKKARTSLGTGFLDPIVGSAQLLAHGVEALEPITPIGGLGRVAAGKLDEYAKDREQYFKDEGGQKGQRFFGNLLNPAAWFGGGEAVAATKAGVGLATRTAEEIAQKGLVKEAATSVGKAAGLGAVGGATQPVANDDFATTKAIQTGVGGAVGGALGAVPPAIAQVGRYLAKSLPENIVADAVNILKDRWNTDAKWGGVTAKEGLETIQKARARGQELTPADVAGADTKALAGRVTRRPGDARSMSNQFLEQRDVGAPQRLEGAVRGFVSENTSAAETADVLTAVQSATSRNAWDKLYQQNVGRITDHFKQLVKNPVVAKGLRRGYQMERNQADIEGRSIQDFMMGATINPETGLLQFEKFPNMRVLDMGKRGLDDIIQEGRDPLTGKLSAEARDAYMLKQAYVQQLDEMSGGAYSRTMQVYAGPAASKDAIKLGQAVFGGHPHEIKKEFDALSEGNKEFFRIGVADAMMEKLRKGGIGSDEAKLLVKNQWVRDQLRPMFRSTQAFDEFMDIVATETKMFETKGATVGRSDTARRLAEDTSDVQNLGRVAMGAARGNVTEMAVNLWRYLKGVQARNDPRLESAIAQLVFGNPDAIQAAQLTGEQAITKTNPALPAARVTNSIGQMVSQPIGGLIGNELGQ